MMADIAGTSTTTTPKALSQIQQLVELERSLTSALEKVDSMVLLQGPSSSSSSSGTPPASTSASAFASENSSSYPRPLPQTMEEVETILNLARQLSSRTSAPAGWNPQAPVVGFATPNPLPHMLRGGALGALQLQEAQQALKQQQQQQQQEKNKRKQEEEAKQKKNNNKTANAPKRVRLDNNKLKQQQQQQRPRPVMAADMNLSDDSSDDSGDDDDDDEMEE